MIPFPPFSIIHLIRVDVILGFKQSQNSDKVCTLASTFALSSKQNAVSSSLSILFCFVFFKHALFLQALAYFGYATFPHIIYTRYSAHKNVLAVNMVSLATLKLAEVIQNRFQFNCVNIYTLRIFDYHKRLSNYRWPSDRLRPEWKKKLQTNQWPLVLSATTYIS